MKRVIPVLALLFAVACGGSTSSAPSSPTTTSSGVFTKTDLIVGTGELASPGRTVTVNYSGWFYDTSKPEGKGQLFDSGTFGPFVLGAGTVIAGWDQGINGMRVGGQRRLIIPPELAYGSAGFGAIPPNATLVFDVALTNVQ